MNGVFGDLFDLDGDGSLDSTELGLDYAMADELIEEEKQKEAEAEASTEDEANRVVTVPITITFHVEEHKEQEDAGLDKACAETENRTVLQEKTGEKQDIPEQYRYCKVTFEQGNSCFYIADDPTVKEGDWVRVLYGRAQEFQVGQVCSVYECTEETAPNPPRLTGHIVNKAEAPFWAKTTKGKKAGPYWDARNELTAEWDARNARTEEYKKQEVQTELPSWLKALSVGLIVVMIDAMTGGKLLPDTGLLVMGGLVAFLVVLAIGGLRK